MWVLAPGAAHMQSSAQLQPPTDIYIYKAACAAVWITKKSMNPLLTLDVHQVVQKVAVLPLGIAERIVFLYSRHIIWKNIIGGTDEVLAPGSAHV